MDFGLFIRGQYNTGDDMAVRFDEVMEQARLAEKLGFASILKGSHYAGYPVQEYQQLPFLARVMTEAPSLRLVTGIVLLPLHKPLDMAEQLATIDVMSKGKLTFGCGIGYRDVEFEGFGADPKDRVARFEENLKAIVRLWTQDHVTMQGSHFTLNDVTTSLKPVRRAARLADTWFINPHQRMDTITRQLGLYKQELDKVNKPFPDELPLMRELFIAPTRDEAIALARPYLEAKYKVYHQWGQDKAMPKDDANLSLDFDELTQDRFLFGSPDEVTEQIIRFNKQLGANHFVLGIHWLGMPNNLALDMMHIMAEEVIPNVESAL